MKTIAISLLAIFVLPVCLKAAETVRSENIEVHVRQEWHLQISKRGSISIHSAVDSHPMANAHTSENVAEFDKVVKLLADGLASFPDGGKERIKSVWAFVPGKDNKIPVSEESLFKLLALASKHWEFPGLNPRLKERLHKHPILTDVKKQNEALHITEGAVVPEKTKE